MLKKIRRDFPLIGSKSEDIDQFVEEIRNCLNEEIPEGCAIKVYKYSVSCCAFIPVGISVEIEGHNEQETWTCKRTQESLRFLRGKGQIFNILKT
ncbi:MAG: hypothetical protein RMK50_04810 [Nitrososphaerota archaeon]|nr:hypothetical protein [Candidatus Bathyarchaeota archaeon]MDW8194121.1 hypothetical protein [Nitrososphaerota archaeon]